MERPGGRETGGSQCPIRRLLPLRAPGDACDRTIRTYTLRMRLIALGVLTAATAVSVGLVGVPAASASTPRAGSVATHFGTHGVVHLPPASKPPAKRIDPVAHVLAFTAGRLWVGADQGFGAYALPLTAAGHPVTTFLHGKPAVPVSNDEQYVGLRSLLPTSDGGALIVSLIGDPSAVQVNRIKASGATDTTWGTGHGSTYLTPACADCSINISGATLLDNGRVRVMGTYTDNATSTHHAMVIGFTPHGLPDTSVGPAGWRVVAGSPDATTQAVGTDTSGRLYFVLDDAGQPALLRTTSDGAIDPTYHTDGVSSITLPGGRTLSQNSHAAAPNASLATLVVSPSGETYVGVNTKTSTTPVRWQALVFHVNSHGWPDQSFGPGRVGSARIPSPADRAPSAPCGPTAVRIFCLPSPTGTAPGSCTSFCRSQPGPAGRTVTSDITPPCRPRRTSPRWHAGRIT